MENDNVLFIDALMLQRTGIFRTWISEESVDKVNQANGLANGPDSITLKETEERQIPPSVKDGTNPVLDIWVPLDSGEVYYDPYRQN